MCAVVCETKKKRARPFFRDGLAGLVARIFLVSGPHKNASMYNQCSQRKKCSDYGVKLQGPYTSRAGCTHDDEPVMSARAWGCLAEGGPGCSCSTGSQRGTAPLC